MKYLSFREHDVKKKLFKNSYRLSAAIILFSFVPILAMSIFSRPCNDDFAYSGDLHRAIEQCPYDIIEFVKVVLQTDWHHYNTFQGLYTNVIIFCLQPGVINPKVYFIGTVLLLLIEIFCIMYYINNLKHIITLTKRESFLLSILVLSLLIQLVPCPVEALYWYCGAWNYMPDVFGIGIVLVLVSKAMRMGSKSPLIGASIISFLISGGNHVCSVLNILILLAIGLFGYIYHFKNKKYVFLPLTFAIIGFCIMYFAPGTAIRQSCFTQPTVLSTLSHGFIYSISLLCEWTTIEWSLLIFITSYIAFFKTRQIDMNGAPSPLVILLTLWIIYCGILCVPFYAMGFFGKGRVINVFWITFVFFSIFFVSYTIVYLRDRYQLYQISDQFWKKVSIVTLIVLSSLLVANPNSTCCKATKELLKGTAQNFAAAFDNRVAEMESHPEQKVFEFDELPNSELLKKPDISADSTYWRNRHWKHYYGVTVILKQNEGNVE